MADIVKNPVSSAIYLEKKDAALLERLKKIHPVKDLFTGKTIWKDTLKGLVYRRLIGGIAWPAPDSYTPMTHLAVLAEERDEDFSMGHHTVHVIYEDMAPTIEEVLNIAVAKQSLLRCAEWVAPIHESEVIRIRQWEKDRMRHRLPRIRIIPPPSVDFLTLHALVQARTVTCKTMFFGEDSIAASAYVSIPAEDYCRPLKRYPQLAAVLYPLGAIDMYTAADIPPGIHIPAEGGY